MQDGSETRALDRGIVRSERGRSLGSSCGFDAQAPVELPRQIQLRPVTRSRILELVCKRAASAEDERLQSANRNTKYLSHLFVGAPL